MERAIEPDEDVLGEVGGVQCAVVVTPRPWELDVDVLVVSAGPGGLGRLGRAMQRDVPGLDWSGMPLRQLTPVQPQVMDVPPGVLGATSPMRWVVLACARDTSLPPDARTGDFPGTTEAAARGTAAALLAAAERRAAVVALPLLGTGAIGLPMQDAAAADLAAVRRTLETLAHSSLRRVVVICLDEATRSEVLRAWHATATRQEAPAPAREAGPPSGGVRMSPSTATTTTPAAPGSGTGGTGPAQEQVRPDVGRPVGLPYRHFTTTALEVLGHATAVAASRTEHPGLIDPPLVLLSALVRRRGAQGGVAGELASTLAGDEDPTALIGRLASVLGVTDESLSQESVVVQDVGTAFEPVLRRAEDYARQMRQTEVHIRHLLAAVVTSEPPLPPDVLAALGVPAEELRRQLRRAVRAMVPEETPDHWDEILGLVTEATELAGGISRDLVDVERGIPLTEDHLGVATYVTMLAAVIAKAETPLPLSVGLFGEWGSGKSYFMGLLRERVRMLSDGEDDAYLSDIVQITFNAWHYADTNLWASLGNEIFEQLAGPTETADQRRDALREELAEKLQRAQQLKAANEQAESETARIRGEIDTARAQRSESVVTLLESVVESATLGAQLPEAWKRLGVQEEAERGRLLADEIRQTGAEVSTLRLAAAGRRGQVAAVVAAVALGLLAAAALIPADWGRWLARGGLGGLAGLLAAATLTVARVRSGLQLLTGAATEIRQKAEERGERAVAARLDELRRADAHETVLRAKLDEVLQRVGELGRELAALSPGQRLYGFVTERAASDDYRRELGLISTIRHDFEHLIELMDDWRKAEERTDVRRPINRIVLYIDDLDRCSPQQVVDVLQAVHLLLALDLFVVVVGVDPRWLLHSLRERYRTIFARPAADGGTPAGAEPADEEELWQTTPQDYLEKIFNIPFVLPGMTGASFEKLIRELSTPRPRPRQDGDGPEPSPVDHHDTPPGPPPPAPGPQGTTAGHEDRPPAPPGRPAAAEVPIQAGSEVAAIQGGVRPVPRRLTEAELALLASLGPLVRTPREAKRLLNLYRMVRSTRDLSVASHFLGGGEQPGEFQAVVVLLGLLTAHPRLLGQLLSAPPAPGVSGGLCHRSPAESWSDVVAGLEPRPAGSRWQNGVCGDLSDAECREWQQLVRRVAPATALVRLPDLRPFQVWGPRVARFSFLLSPLAAGDGGIAAAAHPAVGAARV
jgi:hypothetical protein